jgi:hypothetical protein
VEPSPDHRNSAPGCLGCLSALILFPFCFGLLMWVSVGMSMSCALPNRCSPSEENIRGAIGLIILLGGSFGIPIAAGYLVRKGAQAGNHEITRRRRSRKH